MPPHGKQCSRINQISQADIFQRRPNGPVYLVPVIAHKTAIDDSTGILRTINTAVHRYWTFHSLNDVNQPKVIKGCWGLKLSGLVSSALVLMLTLQTIA